MDTNKKEKKDDFKEYVVARWEYVFGQMEKYFSYGKFEDDRTEYKEINYHIRIGNKGEGKNGWVLDMLNKNCWIEGGRRFERVDTSLDNRPLSNYKASYRNGDIEYQILVSHSHLNNGVWELDMRKIEYKPVVPLKEHIIEEELTEEEKGVEKDLDNISNHKPEEMTLEEWSECIFRHIAKFRETLSKTYTQDAINEYFGKIIERNLKNIQNNSQE